MTHIPPRIAIGGIVHETHSFAPTPTTMKDFQERLLHYGDALLPAMRGTRSALGGMIAGAEERGWQLLPTAYGSAMPGGIVAEAAYQDMLQGLIAHLQAAGAVDGVLLALHGAMVTEQQLDAESEMLQRVRAVVGEQLPIVVVLDMHGNISPRTVELADVLLAFDTNPHIDPHERGLEAVGVLARLLAHEIVPTAAYAHPPLMLAPQATGTDDLPLRLVHQRAAEMERDKRVIAICVMAGFAYADTPFTGCSLIVTTDSDPALARQYADELAALLWNGRQAALPHFMPAIDAVSHALASAGRPVLLIDSADNIGGGTPGDGTDALKALLELNVTDAAVVLADAESVATCRAAGAGAQVTLAVGGKTDQWHGTPVTVTGVVQALSDGVFRCEMPDNPFAAFYGDTIQMGDCAWLRVQGINLLLTTHKTPPFDLGQLRHIGIIPEQQSMIVVKSAVAYRAAYMPIAAEVIEMDTSGLCTANLTRFPYQHLPRPIFPLDVL